MLLKPNADFYSARHPNADDILLLIEVADSSLTFDQNQKLRLYALPGAPDSGGAVIGGELRGEIVHVERSLLHLGRELLGLFLVDGFGRLLDQASHGLVFVDEVDKIL